MAENKTPVQLEVSGFEAREVMLVDYKFNQEVDREGQIAGIPRGGRITISPLLLWHLGFFPTFKASAGYLRYLSFS